ncbi:MAG: enoyl-CoA hydratase/isomerase family protein, partial [Desulfuromonadales bacterium]|nr:enoyl-CoA hydratase/isomerase family protein [Desulfuromonadales bacterium]
MTDANLLLEKDGALATITFNNPKALNALTVATFAGLEQLLNELEQDTDVRVVILTGAGDKAFIAGGDIGHLGTLDVDGARQFALLAQGVINRIETFPKPVIAAING